MPNIIIVGGAGFVARRHVAVLSQIDGCNVVGVVDPFDSVGYINEFFSECRYFATIEECGAWVESGSAPDERPYIVVCSPNYLHVPHAVFALNASCPVLLEKPVACSFGEYSFLRDFVGNGPCFAVLQMRYNHAVSNLRRRKFTGGEKIEFYYCAARGSWYNSSWKGDSRKSGGALFNIGIHAIDIMIDVFGVIRSFEYNGLSLSGEHKFRVCFDGSEVDFYFGLGRNLREFCIDGQRYPLNVNKELHQLMYEDLFAGRGVHVGVLADTVLACEKFRAASGV